MNPHMLFHDFLGGNTEIYVDVCLPTCDLREVVVAFFFVTAGFWGALGIFLLLFAVGLITSLAFFNSL